MAYSTTAFTDLTLHNFYINANSDVTALRTELSNAVAKFTAAGLPSPEDMLEAIDARIAKFEKAIVDGQPASVDPNKPYDRNALIREFLEEVYSVILYCRNGVVGAGTTADPYHENNKYTNTVPDPDVNHTPTFALQGIFADNDTGFTGQSTANPEQVILKYYYELITQTFAKGDALKTRTNPDNVWTVVSISPYTSPTNNVVYDRITSEYIGKDSNGENIYKTYLVPQGIDLSVVQKKEIKNQAGIVTDFEFIFKEGVIFDGSGGVTNPTLQEVEIITGIGTDGAKYYYYQEGDVKEITNFRALSPPEYLYYWNEARIQVLKGSLAYKQALVEEVQEDLRQANAVLAELEKVANIRNLDKDGNYTGDMSYESIQMMLFNSRASVRGDSLFDRDGNDYLQNWGTWQECRINLKNYIDRKSAQSQDMMLDYQQVLNRYNSALEVLSKLQEKLDGLLKSQLRNL
ncbi:hypothetical protein [Verrucomicrobium sp. BvORR034]|uniref:hypothetical protein n=1 Tax=Verrucomicrobium sp. BvORR034 TaxID=1396418 RepID=UPI0006786904|nr:hypothetical protein [Verrucomicrobium sp. BvORR034]